MTHRRRAVAGLLGGSAAAGASVALLLRIGDLLPPPPTAPGAWSTWATTVGPAGAAFSVLRLLGLALGAYLAVCFALAALGSAWSLPRLVLAADRLSFGTIRRTVAASTAGVVLSTSALGGLAGATAPSDGSSAVVMRVVDDRPATATPGVGEPVVMRLVTPASTSTPVVMRLVTPVAAAPEAILPGGADLDVAAAADRSAPATAAVGAGVETATDSRYVVRPGDHLWSIAARTLGAADDGAIDGYWRQLVAANRDVLVDPANPDLLFAGQELRLPPRRA